MNPERKRNMENLETANEPKKEEKDVITQLFERASINGEILPYIFVEKQERKQKKIY